MGSSSILVQNNEFYRLHLIAYLQLEWEASPCDDLLVICATNTRYYPSDSILPYTKIQNGTKLGDKVLFSRTSAAVNCSVLAHGPRLLPRTRVCSTCICCTTEYDQPCWARARATPWVQCNPLSPMSLCMCCKCKIFRAESSLQRGSNLVR